jgi:methyl-accepting chemotaxis protein
MFTFTIKARLISLSIFLTVITALIISVSVSRSAILDSTVALEESAKNRLIAIRNSTSGQIESYFKTISDQIITYSDDIMIIDAMNGFIPAFNELVSQDSDLSADHLNDYYVGQFNANFKGLNDGGTANPEILLSNISNAASIMQTTYIANNPSQLGEKDRLVSANTGTKYDNLHEKYHPTINHFQKQFGFYDIFLVDAVSGHIVYSVFKELDFATSLKTGPYANSGIALAFKQALTATNPDQTFLTDFSPYLPSYNAPASFMSSPIYDDGRMIGVLIFQMPIDRINAIMTHARQWQENGLGNSGETYIVGDDFNMRSDGRFLIEDKAAYLELMTDIGLSKKLLGQLDSKETSIGLQPVNTIGTERALSGNEGFDIFDDYRGVAVLSAYKPLKIKGLNWVIMSEIDRAEAFEAVDALSDSIIFNGILFTCVATVIGALVGWFIAVIITRPLNTITELFSDLAKGEGDLTKRLPVSGNDELSKLAMEFNQFVEFLDATFSSLLGSIVRLVPIAQDQGDVIDSLVESSTTQKERTDKVKQSLSETNQSSETVVSQLDEINKATAAGNKTVDESSELVSNAAITISQLVNNMNDAVEALGVLQKDNDRITSVVGVINGIAEQTNLLALNAAIEAARAGEAGRGFAVVADEVRSLASKTRQSTEEVNEMVDALQNGTNKVVQSIEVGKTNAVNSSDLMSSVTDQLSSVRQAMVLIADQVDGITHAVNHQRQNFEEVNQQYEGLDENFSQSFEVSEAAVVVGEDITKLGEKLSGMVNKFNVSNPDFSTQRRSQSRKNETADMS